MALSPTQDVAIGIETSRAHGIPYAVKCLTKAADIAEDIAPRCFPTAELEQKAREAVRLLRGVAAQLPVTERSVERIAMSQQRRDAALQRLEEDRAQQIADGVPPEHCPTAADLGFVA